MDEQLQARVDDWWADVFGLPLSMLWQPGVTVGMHAGLGDYPGIFVAGRESGVHISLPDWCGRAFFDDLVEVPPHELLTAAYWKNYQPTAEFRVRGPAVHAYTAKQLEFPKHVEEIALDDIASWQDVVSRRKWENAGFADPVSRVFALNHKDQWVAAANLTVFAGEPTDVGILTHPKFRGKGFSSRVARAATAYAVRSAGFARMRTAVDDPRARSVSQSLGFEDYCVQLAILPRD